MSDSSNLTETVNGEIQETKSNMLLGIIGAFLGALLGAVLWVVIYQLGFIASIAGIAIVFCAYKGCTMLSKRRDMKAAVIAIIVSAAVLIVAHFFCWGLDLYNALAVENNITFIDALFSVPGFVFDPEIIATDSDIIISFFKDLLIGFVLIGVGFFYYIRKDITGGTQKAE